MRLMMNSENIELIYEKIAETIDQVGQNQSELFLAKLALLLARETDDPERVIQCINEASQNLR